MKNSLNLKKTESTRKATFGFSLVEMLMVVLVLTIVTGSIFQQISKAQKNYRNESQKLDFTEQQRTFVDQFTRDLRQAGYPTPASAGPGAGANQVAAQTVAITPLGTPTTLTMEGDLDGSGVVQVVTYDYNAATGSLERTASQKGQPANAPLTMVQNVMAPVANPPLFQGCDAAGNCPAIGPIKSVRVSFTLQGVTQDNKVPIQTTMTATARLPNF
jgi:type II secretory pathway pseudopilin PulG